MSFLDKISFWKRSEELELPPSDEKPFVPKSSPLSESGLEPSFAPQQPQFAQPPSAFAQNPLQQPGTYDAELRLISAKLDTIKAMLDVVVQRLERLEKSGGKTEEFSRWR